MERIGSLLQDSFQDVHFPLNYRWVSTLKQINLLALVVLGMALASGQPTQPPKTHLKVGDPAPDFELPSTAGKPVKLSDYAGKNPVVLAFFPAAFTGG